MIRRMINRVNNKWIINIEIMKKGFLSMWMKIIKPMIKTNIKESKKIRKYHLKNLIELKNNPTNNKVTVNNPKTNKMI